MKKYSFWIGLSKLLTNLAIFFGPLVITTLQNMPETSAYLDLSLSSLAYLLINYLKVRNS